MDAECVGNYEEAAFVEILGFVVDDPQSSIRVCQCRVVQKHGFRDVFPRSRKDTNQ